MTCFRNPPFISFEPFAKSFEALQKTALTQPNIRAFNVGLANRCGVLPFHDNRFAATNSLLGTDPTADNT
jgi:hypothetical protein